MLPVLVRYEQPHDDEGHGEANGEAGSEAGGEEYCRVLTLVPKRTDHQGDQLSLAY